MPDILIKTEPTVLEPRPIEQESSFEPRDIVVAALENPKEKYDDTAPILNMFKLQSFFSINSPDFSETQVLNNIYNYFGKKGLESMNQVFIEIFNIEHKLGSTPMGQSRINHLWNYLKVLSQIEEYDNLKQSYERN